MKIREFSGVGSLLKPCGSWGQSSGLASTIFPFWDAGLHVLFLGSLAKWLGPALTCCVAQDGLELVTLLLAAFWGIVVYKPEPSGPELFLRIRSFWGCRAGSVVLKVFSERLWPLELRQWLTRHTRNKPVTNSFGLCTHLHIQVHIHPSRQADTHTHKDSLYKTMVINFNLMQTEHLITTIKCGQQM